MRREQARRISLLTFLVVTLAVSIASCAEGGFNPNKDSYVYEMSPSENFGSRDYVRVVSYSGNNERSYIDFDTSTLPDNAIIDSVELRLYCTGQTGTSGRTYYIHEISGSWTENGVTWNDQPSVYTDEYESESAPSGTGAWHKDITSLFEGGGEDHGGVGAHFGVRIIDSSEGSGTNCWAQFSSRESASNKPVLYVVWHYNNAPENKFTGSFGQIIDMDDIDNVYAEKKWYTFTSRVSDSQGYADIDYHEFRIKQGGSTRAVFRFDEDTNIFSVVSGSSEWSLDVSGSSYYKDGVNLDVTWKFKPQGDVTEESSLEIEVYVQDDEPAPYKGSDLDTAQTDYFDTVSSLTIVDFASDPQEYCNPSSQVTFTGKVRYVDDPGSDVASSSYPPDAEISKVVLHNATHVNKGENNSVTQGEFTIEITSPSIVGQYFYHAFVDMSDSDYPDNDVTGVTDSISTFFFRVVGPFSITSTGFIGDNGTWDDSELLLTFWSSGQMNVTAGEYGNPQTVEVADETWIDWTYDSEDKKVLIYNVGSKVVLEWKTASPPAGPSGPSGTPSSSTSTSDIPLDPDKVSFPWEIPLGITGVICIYLMWTATRKPDRNKELKQHINKKKKRSRKKIYGVVFLTCVILFILLCVEW